MLSPNQTPKLRIAWLLFPPIIGSGGYSNIFRIINLLASFGHDNVIYMHPYGFPADSLERPERFLQKFFGPISARVQLWPDVIDQVDIALATQWGTFEYLDRCVPGVAKGYFVQDYEPFFSAMGYDNLKAEATYRAGVPCITLGNWLGTFLQEKYGATTYPFDFAVEHDRYYPRPELQTKRRRIIFYARPSTPRRCFELGIKALEIVNARHPNVEMVFFGDKDLKNQSVPFKFVDKGILDHDALTTLYASATLGMVLSATNPSLMPPEMMASRCAVVDLDLPPNHFLIDHGQTGLLATPEPEPLAEAICQLLEDEALRQRILDNAEAHVRGFSWEHSARQVEAGLLAIAPPTTERASELRIDHDHWTGDGVTPALMPSFTIGQRYIPQHDQLCRVDFALSRTSAETPTLRIYDGIRPETLLVETNVARSEHDWLIYDFAPLPATHHQALYFTLSADAGPALRFDYRPVAGGALAYNHVPQAGQLLYRTYYRPSTIFAEPLGDAAQEQISYLTARQDLATAEYLLLSEYTDRLHRHAAPQKSTLQRIQQGLQLVRNGNLRGLAREASAYVRWSIARLRQR
ncbi:MAG: glycosyltransferase family 4 protein [Herpetosiphonaceae bacterium]|nr:glycosyltransferase family 4 protein [Herpetosiphonaceae bacterium]